MLNMVVGALAPMNLATRVAQVAPSLPNATNLNPTASPIIA